MTLRVHINALRWYAKVHGKTHAEAFMSGTRKAFGSGAYADKPPKFDYNEQTLSKLRHWLKDQLATARA